VSFKRRRKFTHAPQGVIPGRKYALESFGLVPLLHDEEDSGVQRALRRIGLDVLLIEKNTKDKGVIILFRDQGVIRLIDFCTTKNVKKDQSTADETRAADENLRELRENKILPTNVTSP
jgi:hypothetical protein